MSTSLVERLEAVQDAVFAAALRVGRDPDSVTVVGVCKTVGRESVDEAFAAGLRHFGENRVQDAAQKFAAPLPEGAALHMIGQLQSNKAGVAARLFDIVESVDRLSLIDELDRHVAKRDAVLPVLLQINVGREAQKAGCSPDDAEALAAAILGRPHLELRGLMTIAPVETDAEAARPVFAELRALRERLRAERPDHPLPVLSMGMSNDFTVAIEEGATHIRVGRAIFGG
ncbi:MAG: YggS family pyridoxal phosphate-dependent enzyme [Thermomicrobiales bacterium]